MSRCAKRCRCVEIVAQFGRMKFEFPLAEMSLGVTVRRQ